MSTPPPFPVARSTFVTVTGGVFAGLSGFGMLIGILQNVMFQLAFQPIMQQQLAAQPMPAGLPGPTGWMFTHMIWVFRGFLLLSTITLVAAIGLLLRRNWGRRLFIGVMAFGIAYQLLGLLLQWWFLGSMQHAMQLPSGGSAHFNSQIQQFMVIMQVFSGVMAIGLSVLFGWIIGRLCSAAIRREFVNV